MYCSPGDGKVEGFHGLRLRLWNTLAAATVVSRERPLCSRCVLYGPGVTLIRRAPKSGYIYLSIILCSWCALRRSEKKKLFRVRSLGQRCVEGEISITRCCDSVLQKPLRLQHAKKKKLPRNQPCAFSSFSFGSAFGDSRRACRRAAATFIVSEETTHESPTGILRFVLCRLIYAAKER